MLASKRAFVALAFVVGVVHAAAQSFGLPVDLGPIVERWAARYGPGSSDLAYSSDAIASSPDGGRVFVVGRASLGNLFFESDILTVSYDTGTGNQLWEAHYNGPGTGLGEIGRAVAVSPDGRRVYVFGESWNGTNDDWVVIAYDSTIGNEVWKAVTDSGDDDDARSIAVSPDGSTVYVTGQIGVGNTRDNFGTAAYDAAMGVQLWTARYSGPAQGDGPTALSVSPNGSRIFVTGASLNPTYEGGRASYATVAYDATTGAQLWVSRYNPTWGSSGGAQDVAVSPSGAYVYVTGGMDDLTGSYGDYATIAYNAATGAQFWLTRYKGPSNSHDKARALAVSPDGARVFVTGESESGGWGTPKDYATISYDATTGTQQWAMRYNDDLANGDDLAKGIAMGPDGSSVFVTGMSFGYLTNSFDFATISYRASDGFENWIARYGRGSELDEARAVAASPNGKHVFVAGFSQGSITTLSYCAVVITCHLPI